jgi:hypothetical protein
VQRCTLFAPGAFSTARRLLNLWQVCVHWQRSRSNLNLSDLTKEQVMKMQKAVLISALLLGSGVALAAGGGGAGTGGAGGNGNGNGGGGAPGDSAMTAASGSGPTTMSKSKTKKKHTHTTASKPANDTTNMPGADASSDTKGH